MNDIQAVIQGAEKSAVYIKSKISACDEKTVSHFEKCMWKEDNFFLYILALKGQQIPEFFSVCIN